MISIAMREILKKSIIVLFAMLLVPFVLTNCDSFPEYYYYPHYITDLLKADTILQHVESYHIDYEKLNKELGLDYSLGFMTIYFQEKINFEKHDHTHLIKYPDKERLRYLDSIGDNGYRKREIHPYFHSALWYPPVHIKMKANKDLNSNLQAGKELAPYIMIRYYDTFGYVRDNYGAIGNRHYTSYVYATDSNKLNGIVIPNPYFIFLLTQKPDKVAGEEVEFSLEVTFKDGTIAKSTIPVTFPPLEKM